MEILTDIVSFFEIFPISLLLWIGILIFIPTILVYGFYKIMQSAIRRFAR